MEIVKVDVLLHAKVADQLVTMLVILIVPEIVDQHVLVDVAVVKVLAEQLALMDVLPPVKMVAIIIAQQIVQINVKIFVVKHVKVDVVQDVQMDAIVIVQQIAQMDVQVVL